MDQINADPKGNWYRLAIKKIYQQTVLGSECLSTTGQRGDKKGEDWKRS
jgi:hypothetical protein